MGGLNAAAPGFRVARIAPRPGGALDSAVARHETPYGPLEVRWAMKDGAATIDFTVPVGVTPVLDLPGTPQHRFMHGSHSVELSAEALGIHVGGEGSAQP